VRLEIEVENFPDLSGWLALQEATGKIYWSSRDDAFAVAALGFADVLTLHEDETAAQLIGRVEDKLQGGSDRLRYYGGLAFNNDVSNENGKAAGTAWDKFGRGRFVLPRFELVKSGQTGCFACNIDLSKDRAHRDKIVNELSAISGNDRLPADGAVTIVRRDDCPDRESWSEIFDVALKAICSDQLDKVVLARQTSFDLNDHLTPEILFDRLARNSVHCFHFCFQPDSGAMFMGASPELLYRRDGTEIRSEAIAGTRARGADESSDLEMERQLLASEKEFREHRLVVTGIRDALADLCSEVTGGEEIGIVKLPRVQHLIATMRGNLLPSVGDAVIISTLHPTPAVGGYPSAQALELIDRLEPFDRGWYASPVGWIGHEAAEFAVAIRSGLIHDDTLDLYSGAGLVEGSIAGDEWTEIESKIAGFLKAIS
jgi:menaquinone-specific isochorismate synthase